MAYRAIGFATTLFWNVFDNEGLAYPADKSLEQRRPEPNRASDKTRRSLCASAQSEETGKKMSALSEKLMNFAGSVSAATDAPDAYPDFRVELSGDMETAYQINRQTVLDAWADARRLIKRDLDKVAIIDECLGIAFSAFDAGNKDLGRAKMFEIYNLGLRKLR